MYEYFASIFPIHSVVVSCMISEISSSLHHRVVQLEDDCGDEDDSVEKEYEHITHTCCEPTPYEYAHAIWIHSSYFIPMYSKQFAHSVIDFLYNVPPLPLSTHML
jgi:hypothetical protein